MMRMSHEDRDKINRMIEDACPDLTMEERCLLLVAANEEYARRIDLAEMAMAELDREARGSRWALFGAACYGAAATVALVLIWASR